MVNVKEIFKQNPKVSILVPMYNSEISLGETIESVQAQTYQNWELILVDDCSTDGTVECAKVYAEKDERIHIYNMERNSGPGAATKAAFSKATGGFSAFIDADDLWLPEKLEKQLKFMCDNNYEMVCSDYEQMNGEGERTGRIIKCVDQADYNTVLLKNPIGSSTLIMTSSLLRCVDIPEIRKANDYSLWLQLLKIYPCVYGMHEILMLYRVWPNSISYNKFKKVKYHWKVFRGYEKLSVAKSLFLTFEWAAIKILRIK